jgi:hypothetical protein
MNHAEMDSLLKPNSCGRAMPRGTFLVLYDVLARTLRNPGAHKETTPGNFQILFQVDEAERRPQLARTLGKTKIVLAFTVGKDGSKGQELATGANR